MRQYLNNSIAQQALNSSEENRSPFQSQFHEQAHVLRCKPVAVENGDIKEIMHIVNETDQQFSGHIEARH